MVVPATPADAAGLLKGAVRDENPVVFLEHKGSYRRDREEVPPDAPALRRWARPGWSGWGAPSR